MDGKGAPISGLKVIAKQVQPIKGYEQFESKTGSDGTFSFGGLYPSSEYVITVWHKDWSTDAGAQVTAGPEGETILLKEPIVIRMALNTEGSPVDPQTDEPRFGVSNDSVIADSLTGLEWFVGPDNNTTWDQAKAWCTGLSVAGGGWRMPTLAEFKTLYIKGLGERNMAPCFETTGWWVWSGEVRDSSSAWLFNFHGGEEDWDSCSGRYYSDDTRAFAVRSR